MRSSGSVSGRSEPSPIEWLNSLRRRSPSTGRRGGIACASDTLCGGAEAGRSAPECMGRMFIAMVGNRRTKNDRAGVVGRREDETDRVDAQMYSPTNARGLLTRTHRTAHRVAANRATRVLRVFRYLVRCHWAPVSPRSFLFGWKHVCRVLKVRGMHVRTDNDASYVDAGRGIYGYN